MYVRSANTRRQTLKRLSAEKYQEGRIISYAALFFLASKSEAYTKRRCVERQKDQEEIAMAINSRKVAMVGCGFVGSASAFALMQSKLFSEMVLIDADQNRAEGEALDISHGMAFASPMKIYAGSDPEKCKDHAVHHR